MKKLHPIDSALKDCSVSILPTLTSCRTLVTAYYDLQKELVVAWRHLETTRRNRDRIEKTDYRLK